jgi:hypothetical protein
MLVFPVFLRRMRRGVSADVTHPFTARRFDRCQPEFGWHARLPGAHLRHGEHEYAVGIGRVRKRSIHRFNELDLALVRTNGPFRNHQPGFALMRTALIAVDGDPGAVNANANVLRLQTRHRGRQHDAVRRLMDTDGEDLSCIGHVPPPGRCDQRYGRQLPRQ